MEVVRKMHLNLVMSLHSPVTKATNLWDKIQLNAFPAVWQMPLLLCARTSTSALRQMPAAHMQFAPTSQEAFTVIVLLVTVEMGYLAPVRLVYFVSM